MITTFRLESITLGTDNEGNETTAPVVVQAEAKSKAGNFADAVFASLEQAILEGGQRMPDGSPGVPDHTMAVPTNVWKNRFCADCRDREERVTKDPLRRRYGRGVEDLIKCKKVAQLC